MTSDFLQTFTDPHSLSDLTLKRWVEDKLALLRNATYGADVTGSFTSCTLDTLPDDAYGAEASPAWRRFFLGVLLADWACYEKPVDRIDVTRLKYIMSSAYQYFRLWTCRLPNGEVLPVGYTGWYPVAADVFENLVNDPTQIADRGAFVPLRGGATSTPSHLYMLNASIIVPLRNTLCAHRMSQALRVEWRQMRHAHVAAITVADEGNQLAEMSGLRKICNITVQGDVESLFVRRAF